MKVQDINLDEIKSKLIDKLRASGWADKLKGFLLSDDFDKIMEFLYNQRQAGKRFTPPLKTMFTAFEKCKYSDLKVVIIGQDPYPTLGVADGMAFSCSSTMLTQPSLEYIFKAIDKTVYSDNGYENPNPDLSRWAEQGVLLLNTALTTEIDKPGMHQDIWKPFITYLLDILNVYNSGLVFIFMGRKAEVFEDLIGDNHYKLITSHPASAAYNNQEQWDSKGVFTETNKILKGIINDEINW